MEQINYEAEVRKVYSVKSDIDCDFYFDKKAKEKMWHIDVIDYEKERMVCIGKGLFKKDAWKSAYETLVSQNKIVNQNRQMKKTDIEMIQDIGFIACFLMGIALPIILAFILKK